MSIPDWKLEIINWPETQNEFGYKSLNDLNKRSKVIVNCVFCDALKTITIECIRKRGNQEYTPICKSCQQKRTWANNEEFRQNQSQAQSKAMKKVWEDTDYRRHISKVCSKNAKNNWQNEEYRRKVTEGIIARHKNVPGYTNTEHLKHYANKRIEAIKRKYESDPDYKKRISESNKKLWKDPNFRSKMMEIYKDPKYREKLSRNAKELWQNAEYATKCANNNFSKLEELFASILDDMNIGYYRQYHIGYWPFDFMIPNDPKNILIEVNGEYWHGKKHDYNRGRDKAKATYVEKYHSDNYLLHIIWEHEFYSNNRIQRIIESLLCIEPEQKDFSFSDCSIYLPEAEDANIFFTKYHYTSSGGRNGINIGVKIDGTMIACARFCNPTRAQSANRLGINQDELLELTRFAIHPSYQKKNFASWALSKFLKLAISRNPNIKYFLTFADESYGHQGIIYKATNWTYDGTIDPDYFYVDKDGYIMHKRTLWGRASRNRQSEATYSKENGYCKRWGKQKHRYILKVV